MNIRINRRKICERKIEENSIQALASKNTDILSDGENVYLMNIIDVKEI
ncbi:MAG: hypothetical protein ACLU2J_02940 [Clostridia bacterium]